MSLAKALLAVQKDMPAIKPDAVNPHFRNQYVSLDHMLAVALPILNTHGVSLVQFPSHNDLGAPTLTTTLLHESGDELSASMPLFLPKNDPQGQGSAITYARRYALAAALGISGEKDDDGEAAVKGGQGERPAAAVSNEGVAPAAATNGDPVCTFGQKHKGETLSQILAKDSSYIVWVLEKFEPRSPEQQAFVDAARALKGGHSPANPADSDIPFDRTGG